MEVLKKYNAKLEEKKSIYDHNKELIDILNQLNLSDEDYVSMVKIIKYHDIGKVVDSFQHQEKELIKKGIRHEILSASIAELDDRERIAILTHHRTISYIVYLFNLIYTEDQYERELDELAEKTGLKVMNIEDWIYKLKRSSLIYDKKAIRLKGILNYCDHLASAGIKNIDKGFDAREIFKFAKLNSIQKRSRLADDDIIIIGATGSGKTEAALYWSDNFNYEKDKRIYYILPYTASINAMYERFKDKGISVGMLHSKAQYFLFKDEEDDDTNKSTKEIYQTFKYFTKQITLTTIHQVFKAVFNCKFNEMMLFMYTDSIFIIDEIHCFDQRELAIILNTLKFLKDNYNIRICIMSASISTRLIELIKKELEIENLIRLSKKENSLIARHRINLVDDGIESSINNVVERYKKGKKVLVVINNIGKAQKFYENLIEGEYDIKTDDIILIHSEFNERDREAIERRIMNIEENKEKSKILIGTSAIEVSLNIDYDEMYTELSPIDSQIQRWGRVNRKRPDDLKDIKDIFIYNYMYMDEDNLKRQDIYDETILKKTKEVLETIDVVDENKIQDYLDLVYDNDFSKYYLFKDKMETTISNIKLGKWENNNLFEDIYRFRVLPTSLYDEYTKLIKEKNYQKANALFVSISSRKYFSAERMRKIKKLNNSYRHINIIDFSYDNKKGLQFLWT